MMKRQDRAAAYNTFQCNALRATCLAISLHDKLHELRYWADLF